jgi:arsenite methyltransferase
MSHSRTDGFATHEDLVFENSTGYQAGCAEDHRGAFPTFSGDVYLEKLKDVIMDDKEESTKSSVSTKSSAHPPIPADVYNQKFTYGNNPFSEENIGEQKNSTIDEIISQKEDFASSLPESIWNNVEEYYGKVLNSYHDLKTNACCTTAVPPGYIRSRLENIHKKVSDKYYGCGFVVPELLRDLSVLDLGCGAGRDCFLLAQLVGEEERVVGIDMVESQLQTAKDFVTFHADRFGYKHPNTEFRKGYIERLADAGMVNEEFDLVVSNCVLNLSPDKTAVFREAHRVLRNGGEMYFSDVYCNKRISYNLRKDPILWGECLSGALYWNDFMRLVKACGFMDPRLVEWAPITIQNPDLAQKLNGYEFYAVTYRLWKIPGLEPDCEDYGQAVMYKGNMSPEGRNRRMKAKPGTPPAGSFDSRGSSGGHSSVTVSGMYDSRGSSGSSSGNSGTPTFDGPKGDWELFRHQFKLDDHHVFLTGRITPVCGNTFRMLKETRFCTSCLHLLFILVYR